MRTQSVAVALALVFALAACSGSEESVEAADATTDATDAAAESSDATTPAETTEATTDEPATTEAPTTTEADAGDGSCLVGSWVIDQDEMNKYYDALTADTGTGDDFDIEIVGGVTLDFDGENYVYGAGFTLELNAGGISGEGVSTGGVSGTYTAIDGVITTELGSSDLDVVIEVAGITVNGSDMANGALTDLPINNAPFDCAGPTLGFQSGADDSVRHDVLLKPA